MPLTKKDKKIAMVISFRSFRDEEYFIPKDIFEKQGIKVFTVSEKLGTAIGGGGGDTEVDLTFDDLNVADFDAVVFTGGPGAYKYIEDEKVHRIVKYAFDSKKILAAICVSPMILAKAGVLREKKATVWSSSLERGPIKILKENGAEYQDKPVVKDGNIITAKGPDAAREFAEEIIQVL